MASAAAAAAAADAPSDLLPAAAVDVDPPETADSEDTAEPVREENPTCLTRWGGVRRAVGHVVHAKPFDLSITGVIMLNTLALALQHHRMDETLAAVLDVANLVFTVIFALEMLLKLLVFGPREYVRSKFNVFDGVVVLFSFTEIAVEDITNANSPGISALRAFRLFRVFKLAKAWPDLRRLIAMITRSVMEVANASLVLLIVMFIFVLLGMQLFGGVFDDPSLFDEKPRAHFDNFYWAFVTVFQVLTGENWNEVLQNGMHATGFVAVVYFTALVLFGNFIILNLFLAILIGNFESASPDDATTRTSFSSDLDSPISTARLEGREDDGRNSSRAVTPRIDGSSLADTPRKSYKTSTVVPFSEQALVTDAASLAVPAVAAAASTAAAATASLSPATDATAAATTTAAASAASAADVAATSVSTALASSDSAPTASATPTIVSNSSIATGPTAAVAAVTSTAVAPSLSATSRSKTVASLHVAEPATATTHPPTKRAKSAVSFAEPSRGAAADGDRTLPRTSSSGRNTRLADGATPPAAETPEDPDSGMELTFKKGGADRVKTVLHDGSGKSLAVNITATGDVTVLRDDMSEIDSEDSEGVKAMSHEGAKKTFFLFAPDHPVRQLATAILGHQWFGRGVLLLIAISSIFLAVDEPRIAKCEDLPADDPDSCRVLSDVLFYSDAVLTGFFVGEMVLKLISLGGFDGKYAYFRSGWNVLDFVIVVISVLSLALTGVSGLKSLRALRALRALRPLRVVSRHPGLKLVVNAIFGSLPRVSSVALVNFLFIFIFAVVGVQSFAGSLSSCSDPDMATRDECVGIQVLTTDTCSVLPTDELVAACAEGAHTGNFTFERIWHPVPQHYDNTLNALLTVFEVATGEMWPDMMYSAVDAVGPDVVGERDYNPAAALFFIFIQLVCSFFMLEIFTGIIIDNFNQLKEEFKGGGLLTQQQQLWVESMKMMLSARPLVVMRAPPDVPGAVATVRKFMYHLAMRKKFELSIMLIIVLNAVVMGMRYYGQTDEYETVLNIINDVFTVVFAVEATIKLIGFGVRQYFSVGWNIFDFVLVAVSLVGLFVDLGQIALLLRVVRVLRVIRLVRMSRGVLQLIRTLIFSLPSLANVSALLLLLFFIYACLGMNLFANVKRGEFLSDDANFDSFFVSLLTLFRSITGESYNGIMHDCMVQPPFCVAGKNCGNTIIAPLYFISFFILSSFIVLNLLVAIVLDNFGDTVEMDEKHDEFRLTTDMLEHFQEVWAKHDPRATNLVSYGDLASIVEHLRFPLGFRGHPGVSHKSAVEKHVRRLLQTLDIAAVEGERYAFQVVLQALVHNAGGRHWKYGIGTAMPKLQVAGELKVTGRLAEEAAVRSIQAQFRVFIQVKRERTALGLPPIPQRKKSPTDAIFKLVSSRKLFNSDPKAGETPLTGGEDASVVASAARGDGNCGGGGALAREVEAAVGDAAEPREGGGVSVAPSTSSERTVRELPVLGAGTGLDPRISPPGTRLASSRMSETSAPPTGRSTSPSTALPPPPLPPVRRNGHLVPSPPPPRS